MAMYPKTNNRIAADNASCSSSNNNSNNQRAENKTSENSTTDSFLSVQQREQLGENDIICSKNSFAHKHSGNRRYNALIAEHREAYQSTKQRYERTFITTQVISTIEKEYKGRFVKLAPKASADTSNCWIELEHEDKREKVAHALRSASNPLTKYKRRKRATSANTTAASTTASSTNKSMGRVTPDEESHLPKKKRKVSLKNTADDISSVSSASVSSYTAIKQQQQQFSPKRTTSPAVEQKPCISLSTLASVAAVKEFDIPSVQSNLSSLAAATMPLIGGQQHHHTTAQALLQIKLQQQQQHKEEEKAIFLARQILQSRRAAAAASLPSSASPLPTASTSLPTALQSQPQQQAPAAAAAQPNALLNPFLATRALAADTSLDISLQQLLASQQQQQQQQQQFLAAISAQGKPANFH